MQAQLRKPYGREKFGTAGHLTPRDHRLCDRNLSLKYWPIFLFFKIRMGSPIFTNMEHPISVLSL